MISLDIIPKIIFKPAEAFEELKDNVTPSEGIIMFSAVSAISLVLFGIVSSIVRLGAIAFPFGFGYTLTLSTAFLFFGIEIIGILLISFIGNFLAEKFKGKGNFKETFSLVCYSYSFNIVPAVASAIALLWLRLQINAGISALNSGVAGSAEYLGVFNSISTYGSAVFSLWILYILATAISTSHGISKAKGIAVVIAGLLAVAAVGFLAGNLLVHGAI